MPSSASATSASNSAGLMRPRADGLRPALSTGGDYGTCPHMPTTRVRFGIQTPQEGASFDALAAHWREADALGYDTIWLDDHFYGVVRPAGEPQLEGFTTLAALARETSRIEMGLLVACNSYRNPALLAKMAASVDNISGGRYVHGIGSG